MILPKSLRKPVFRNSSIALLMVPLISSFSLVSCTKVLSRRTDEQVWMEFDKDVRMGRAPSSVPNVVDSKAVLDLRDALAQIPVRTILLKCGDTVSPRPCYQNALTLQFDEVFRASQTKNAELKAAEYKREQKLFFTYRSFDSVSDEVNRFHQSVLSGLDLKSREHAKDLLKTCEDDDSQDSHIENFDLLNSLTTEMPKGTYACLSSHWQADQDQLLQETSERLGLMLVTEEAKRWVKREQVDPVYDSEMSAIAEKHANADLARFQQDESGDFEGFDSKLSLEKNIKTFAPKLREKYPFSPVEQWIAVHAKKKS